MVTAWHSTSIRLIIALLIGNLALALLVFTLHAPWGSNEETGPPALPDQLRDLQHRIAQGHHGEAFELTLSDADLTAAAAYFAAGSNSSVPFTRIRVALADDRLGVDAVTGGLAFPVPVHATVSVAAVDEVPRARIEDVLVAGENLPPFVHNQILAQANSSLDLSRYDLLLTVDAFELGRGSISIHGPLSQTARPSRIAGNTIRPARNSRPSS